MTEQLGLFGDHKVVRPKKSRKISEIQRGQLTLLPQGELCKFGERKLRFPAPHARLVLLMHDTLSVEERADREARTRTPRLDEEAHT